MAGLIGLLNSNGIDLSYIFLSGTNATMSRYLIGTRDLSTYFKGSTAGSIYTNNVGYIMSSGLDMSRFFEPLQVNILNNIFAFPALTTNTRQSITSSTPNFHWSVSGNIILGNGVGPWTTIALTSIIPICTQYCIFQSYQGVNPFIFQNITLQNLNYELNFWIIPRNNNGNTVNGSINLSLTTTCVVSIDTAVILTYSVPRTTNGSARWTKFSLKYTATAGTYQLKFLNNTTDGTDSSFLITGIYMIVV